MANDAPNLFCALLKYWRGRRGMSQLDLALHADVSSRHISFMETGRARPSRDMVLRLGAALEIPLRDQNGLLDAAGFEGVFDEPGLGSALSRAIRDAIERMLQQQEPFPMMVMNRRFDVLRTNQAANRLLVRAVADPSALTGRLNVLHALFDPRLVRPFVTDWERTARGILSRLHRDALRYPEDTRLTALLEDLFAYPDVPAEWRQPDFSVPSEPTFTLRLERDGVRMAFLTTLTVFSAPQNVTLDELQIEAYFPLDPETEAECRRAAAS